MEYNFREIERKWQKNWKESGAYKVSNDSSKPKCYVLDMFPYPSGAGLHVGHPLGYIASDIYSRYKRLKGFNVLHPMGYDAFGLPAEQYALEQGVHPAVSTEQNIANFRKQLDNIGFCYDWDREVRTSDPKYYKWTQWIFLQLFNSYYDRNMKKAMPITKLEEAFAQSGNTQHPSPSEPSLRFSAAEWNSFSREEKMKILMGYRLAYCGYGEVNWCEALGTVLANDEVVNGVSERGGFPVVKKKLRQWYLRITEYADRLLESLNHLEFSDAMKEMQTNWIGKSYGAEIDFRTENGETITCYTTRPDTIFGVDFMVLAPEHELVQRITSEEQKNPVDAYIEYVQSRSERERQAEKKVTGCFTGAYAINPFNGRKIPIWISEYVLAGYGTGAIMAVPCGDERDFKFARHFNIPITNIIGGLKGDTDNQGAPETPDLTGAPELIGAPELTGASALTGTSALTGAPELTGASGLTGTSALTGASELMEANPTKDAILINSDFLNGMVMRDAVEVVISKLEEMGIGKRKTNFRMRDAAFSRQRYWGEPFPIKWEGPVAVPLSEEELPLELPHVDSYSPGPEGEGPLANIRGWVERGLETNTMPGYAGSSWYFLRYMDPHNDKEFCSRTASDYWQQVDVYVGGTEHAVGHLLYSRMWTKVLYDLGHIGFDEPFRKLINQGMIQGSSRFVYRLRGTQKFISAGLIKEVGSGMETYTSEEVDKLHVDVNLVDGYELNTDLFKQWRNGEYASAEFELENGKYICGAEVEKMSKSKFNTVNPDDLVEKYGADTFRMYEMFLGPVEVSKPWDTKGIEGVHRFVKKLCRLFSDEEKGWLVTDEAPSDAEWKSIYKAIKKVEEDTEKFSFNTAVSTFMIAVNELQELKCHKKAVLEKLLIVLTPYAPHIAEELWHQLGNEGSILDAAYPEVEEKYLVETSKEYPVSVNGKLRTTLMLPLEVSQEEVETQVLKNEVVQKWLDGKAPTRIIYVKGRMINVVIK